MKRCAPSVVLAVLLLLAAQLLALALSDAPNTVSGVATSRSGAASLHGLGLISRKPSKPASATTVLSRIKQQRLRLLRGKAAPFQSPALPSSYDNSAGLPPVGDQGQQGSCTSWATGYYYKTYQEGKEYGWSLTDTAHQFSPAFLYHQVQNDDGGSTFEDNLDLLTDQGCCSMSTMPYSDSDYLTWPTAAAYLDGIPHRGSSYDYLGDGQTTNIFAAIQAVLSSSDLCVVGIPIYRPNAHTAGRFDLLSPANFDYNGPSPNDKYMAGYHAVAIVGYDQSRFSGAGGYKIVNSWGTGWGNYGFAWLSQQFLATYAYAFYEMTDRVGYAPTALVHFTVADSGWSSNQIAVTLGAGNTQAPFWSKLITKPIPRSALTLDRWADVTEGAAYMPPTPTDRWWIDVSDQASRDAATLSVFDIQYSGTVYSDAAVLPLSGPATALYAYIPASAIQITTSSLPSDTVAVAYNQVMSATGAAGALTWSISSGGLPAGLSLVAATGAITGTPTASGTSNFTAMVADSTAATATKALAIVINAAPSITTSSLPADTAGIAYSQTLVSAGGTSPLTWSLQSGSLPAGLSLVAGTGAITGTPTTSGTCNFIALLTDNLGATATKALYIAINAAPSITTSSLPNGVAGAAYDQTIVSTGGTAPIAWLILSGSLPGGLSLAASTGAISGIPTSSGTASFTAKVTDSVAATATKALSITVVSGVTITTSSLPATTVGATYSQALAATGGVMPYTWAVLSGSLPAGLSLVTSTGAITGTPAVSGTSSFTTRVTDDAGSTATQALSIVVNSGVTITTASLPADTVNVTYSQTMAATGGTGALTWSIAGGALPAGLSLVASTGAINGTPSAAGASSFTAQVTDSAGATGTKALSVVISAAISITTASLPADTINIAYPSTTLGATGGTGALTWSILSGSLPAGLSLVAATGAITGTPTATGESNFTAMASDTVGATGTKALSMVINAAPSITTTSLPADTVGIAYDQTLAAAGGTGILTWSVSSGGLPGGLSLVAATGAITGTPMASGTSNFTGRVTDDAGSTATQALSIVINAAVTITTDSLPADTIDFAYSQTMTATGATGVLMWSISNGALPTGLSLNSSTGAITGIPTSSGTASFTAMATDTVGATGTKALSIVISAAPSVATTSLPNGEAGVAYNQALAATGGATPIAWSLASGSLPSGLTLESSDVISGTPTAVGTWSFTVRATDAFGATATGALSITIVTSNLQVTSPNGGESWAKGTSHAITWTSTLGGNVKIGLYKSGVLKSTISSSTANSASGSKSWSVPSTVPAGTDYKVRITWLADTAIYDESDGYFTIPPYISVSAPASGKVWQRGTTQVVKWTSNAGGNVSLQLFKGAVLDSVITPSTSNSAIGTNSYSWPIPPGQAMSSSYKITVTSIESSGTYVSSSSFSITGNGTYVTVTSPNGGEIWQVGNSYNVTWTSDCEDGMKIELYKAGKLNKTLVSFTANSGAYSWPISTSQTLGSDYTVKVTCASNSALNDVSNATFSITMRGVTISALSMTPTTARPGQAVTVNSISGAYQAATSTETTRLVLGLRDSSGHWVGGDPVVVFTGTPGDTVSHPWAGSTPTISAPTKTGNYYFWALNSAAADDASAIADFKARTVTSSVTPNSKWPATLVVSGQVITVTYPNGGETWTTGSSYTITWTSYVGGTVNVDLYKGSTKVLTIGAGVANSGGCPWTVPVGFTLSTIYKVKVTSTATSSWYDYGNAYFTIAAGGALSPLMSASLPLSAPAGTSQPSSTGPLVQLAAAVAATSHTGAATDGLVDGDGATGWQTLGTTLPETEFVTLDVGGASPLCAVGLAPGSDTALFPSEFTIEVSVDGIAWAPVIYAKDFQAAGASLWRFEPVQARYVRISGPGMKNASDGRYYWELEAVTVYGQAQTP